MIAVWTTVLSLPFLVSSTPPTDRQALLFLTAFGYEVTKPGGPQMIVTRKTRKDDDEQRTPITFAYVKEILPRVCDSMRLRLPPVPGPRVNLTLVLASCEWLEQSAISFLTRYGMAVNSGYENAAPTRLSKYGGNTTYTQVDALLPWACWNAVDNGYRGLSQYNLVTVRFACNFLASKLRGYPQYPLNLNQEYTSIVVRFLKGIADIIYTSGDEDHESLSSSIYDNGMITPDQAKPYVEEIMNAITSRGRHHAVSTHDAGLIMAACRYLKKGIYQKQQK